MNIEFDEKGKFFTNVDTKISVPATIQTTSQLIRGDVHVRKGERLNEDTRKITAITEAAGFKLGADLFGNALADRLASHQRR